MQQQYQCSNCGAPVAFGVRFCGNCGLQLSWQTQQQVPPPFGNSGVVMGQKGDLGTVRFHGDAIFHSRAADVRGDESNVLYLTLLPKGIRLAQKGPTLLIRPKILKIKYLCKVLAESMVLAASKDKTILNPGILHFSYLYPAMADAPNSSIPTAHGNITIYDNCALQPTEPLNFITPDEETFSHALAERYVQAVVHFESDYKTLRRIIRKERWGKIPIFIPSSDARNRIPTSELGILRSLANDWIPPSI
jgi:hypothetical protein